MSNSILIPGRADPVTAYRSTTTNLASTSVPWAGIFIFKLISNPGTTNLSGSPQIFRIGADSSGAAITLTNASGGIPTFSVSYRLSTVSNVSAISNLLQTGEIKIVRWLVVPDAGGDGVLKMWVNDTKILDNDIETYVHHQNNGRYMHVGGASIADRDIEIYAAAEWETDIPTETELQNLSAEIDGQTFFDQIDAMSQIPTRGFAVTTGTDGAYVSEIVATWGADNLAHYSGADDEDEDYATFSIVSADVLTNAASATTAIKVTLSADSTEDTGTLFIVGDYPGNFTVTMTGEIIESGLVDGEPTDALFKYQQSMVGQTEFDVELPVNLAATELRFYAVQKDEVGEYSNILTFNVTTKTPAVTISDDMISASEVLLAEETGISLVYPNSAGEITGLETDTDGIFDPPEIDLTSMINDDGVLFDIGDTRTFIVVRSNGEKWPVDLEIAEAT